MAALKITKEEGSEDDRFYLLESHVHSQRVRIDDNGREYIACPVVSREVSKETWWISPATHEKWVRIGMYQVTHRKVHGRRMNDEVEMFGMEDGKETESLQQDLLELGLTVRSHIPEPTKRPSLLLHNTRSKPIPKPNDDDDDDDDEEARKKSHLTHSTALLKSAIATHELTTHRPTPFALLANAGSTDPHTCRPRILIAVLQETQFRDFFQRGYEDFKSNGCSYRVFGTYCRGEVGWVCGDEEFGGYFPRREGGGGGGDGGLECRWWDDAALVEADERARERRLRRREKRERQRRGGEGGLELVGEVGVEVHDGASTEAKKERARAKRKARAARRKAREAASGFTVLVESPSDDGEEDARYSVWSIAAGSKKRAKSARNKASVPRSLADGSPGLGAKGMESSSASSSDEDLDRAELAKELAKLMVGASTQVLVAYPKSDD
ncbi:hypothetical protein LTR91_021656 [Friedmanniomyces endolithicus]|uniref:Uncharacterized protein n=1 Tax=Friedmanniomyces endolithicus TaxID=329885 RepID=A0AAN6HC90_9PEZI|nr:hypothetical protein LTR38_015214 [Friedmanniomyces endolithicus]KAK0957110.1 hypothetical protein LTS01_022513 [Friedmanniomyces endolithicus]KAK0957826.1 hypothetical protein LTR91_021656 [Friedmanniomyces endolithicus]